jgi:hypothetical protein
MTELALEDPSTTLIQTRLCITLSKRNLPHAHSKS